MAIDEKKRIEEFPLIIVGDGRIIGYIKEDLNQLGFANIHHITEITDEFLDKHVSGILIEYIGGGHSQSCLITDIPVIFLFDFIDGAGAIVLFPGDCRDWLDKQNIRLWAAEYMSGYCAFWNVEGCEWLYEALPSIGKNMTSNAAMKTAAYVCARIAANIAVGRDVKHYPRFYLCRNLE